MVVDEGDDWKSVEVPADAGAPPASSSSETSQPPPSMSTPAPSSAPAATSHGSDRLLGPAVKNYLRKYGLNSSNVPASGPHGTVTKGDVLNHVLVNKIEPVALGMN